MNFVHLHNHSYMSLMDGLNSPLELMTAAKDSGQTSMAITDHGTLSGHRAMQEAARSLEMKPILGLEAYISPTDRFDRRSVKTREDNTSIYNHIIILAKDQAGLRNLQYLSEEAWRTGYYFKPRIDRDLLAERRDGLIVLSGCMNGLIAKAIERGDEDEANELTRWFKETFDQNFYMEVQAHNPPELNAALLDLADRYSIEPVATADCHYARPEDKWLEEALLILSTGQKVSKDVTYAQAKQAGDIFERLRMLYPDRPISFEEISVYVSERKSLIDEFTEQGITRTDIFDNSLAISDQIGDYEYYEKLDLLPKPKTDPNVLLRNMAYQGLKDRGVDTEQYRKRLEMELGTIEKLNFASYFLVVGDMVQWAKSQGFLVGPGRGSACGSLLAYAIKITNVDPIKYGLLFGRFINEERRGYPDIDIDFPDRNRKAVKDYLTRKFKNVASISTYTYFTDKSVVRDAARVFGVPLSDVNKALKSVDTFEAFETSPNSQEFRTKYPEVLDLARRLRGKVRNVGMHASGVVVANRPLSEIAPIETRKDPNSTLDERLDTLSLDMNQAADIGLIKLDLLGLKGLSIISDTIDSVMERHGIEIDPLDIPLDDPKVYAMIAAGFTSALFQAEATPSTKLIMQMGVSNFEELAVSNALVRPGAMDTVGASYLARKEGREQTRYIHEIMRPYTEETYGLIIYQEQVMQACVYLAGMSWLEADKVREIIGKKKDVHEFDAFKDRFVEGARKHISKGEAEKLWHDFEAHAGYSFNKSHAIGYSMLTYWMAYLKYYYPIEFMCAVLANETDKDSLTGYYTECKRLGIPIRLPHVNMSGVKFQIESRPGEPDAIRIGLGNIKYISDKTAPKILSEAPFMNYKQLVDLCELKGSGVSTRMVSALNKVGAAAFPDNPRKGDEKNNYYEYLQIPTFDLSSIPAGMMHRFTKMEDYEESGVFVLLGMVKSIVRKPGWARIEMVDETASVGIFHNENTAVEAGNMYVFLVADNRIQRYIHVDEIKDLADDTLIQFLTEAPEAVEGAYYVVDFNSRKSKAGKPFASVVIAKGEEMRKVMVFSTNYRMALGKMRPGHMVQLSLAKTQDDGLYVKEFPQ